MLHERQNTVEVSDLLTTWEDVQSSIPRNGFRDNAEAAIAVLQDLGASGTLSVDDNGNPTNTLTKDFIAQVDEKHGSINSGTQGIKAFPFQYHPSALREEQTSYEESAERYSTVINNM